MNKGQACEYANRIIGIVEAAQVFNLDFLSFISLISFFAGGSCKISFCLCTHSLVRGFIEGFALCQNLAHEKIVLRNTRSNL